MKKYITLFLLLWSTAAVYAQNDSSASYSYYKPAAQTTPRRNIIKMAPFKLIASTMSISYERALSPHSSFMVTGLLTSATNRDYSFAGYDVVAFGGGGDVELRTYPLTEYTPMKGYFVGLYGSVNYTGFDYMKNNNTNASGYPIPEDEYIARYGAGVLMGYQFIIKEMIALDLYAGGGIRKVDTNINDYYGYYNNPFDILSSGTSSGIYPRAGFNFGLCF